MRLRHAICLQLQAHGRYQMNQDAPNPSLDADYIRAVKFLHRTLALLQFIGGKIRRQERYDCFTSCKIDGLIDCLMMYSQRSPGERRMEDLCY